MLQELKSSWFVISDWRISIHFLCFCFSGSKAGDRNDDGSEKPSCKLVINF